MSVSAVPEVAAILAVYATPAARKATVAAASVAAPTRAASRGTLAAAAFADR